MLDAMRGGVTLSICLDTLSHLCFGFLNTFMMFPSLVPATSQPCAWGACAEGHPSLLAQSGPNARMFLGLPWSVPMCLINHVGVCLHENTVLSSHFQVGTSLLPLKAGGCRPVEVNREAAGMYQQWFSPFLSSPRIYIGRSCYCCFPFSLPCQTRSFLKPTTS